MSLLTEAYDLLGVLANGEALDKDFYREQCAKARELMRKIAAAEADQEEIDLARNEYGSDEVEIDDDATTSRSDDGTWVSAWVWLSNDDLELAEECEFEVLEVEGDE